MRPKTRTTPAQPTQPSTSNSQGFTPNPAGRVPNSMLTAPALNAYGNWVATWAAWSQPVPVLERTVVSEMGEQWSPQVAPDKTAALVARASVLLGSI